jgi:hypothetical protein
VTVPAFSHRPTPVRAIQFDGTVPGLMTIFGVVAPAPLKLTVTIEFDESGTVISVTFTGQVTLAFRPGDWLVIPDEGGSMFVLSDVDFKRDWQ